MSIKDRIEILFNTQETYDEYFSLGIIGNISGAGLAHYLNRSLRLEIYRSIKNDRTKSLRTKSTKNNNPSDLFFQNELQKEQSEEMKISFEFFKDLSNPTVYMLYLLQNKKNNESLIKELNVYDYILTIYDPNKIFERELLEIALKNCPSLQLFQPLSLDNNSWVNYVILQN